MVPLSMTPSGARVKIARVAAGSGLRTRLANMGIYEGTVVEVVSNIGRGPVIISRDEARYGLGFGMARRIFVTPASSQAPKRE